MGGTKELVVLAKLALIIRQTVTTYYLIELLWPDELRPAHPRRTLQVYILNLFFFQAEDGIRDHCVNGVQTCALPILIDARAGGSDTSLSVNHLPCQTIQSVRR